MDRLASKIFRSLYRIRRVEEEVARVYPTDKIKSPVHLSIGQEAVSVGVCEALSPGDVAFGTYRSHALYLAKGGDLKKMIAELYGRASGCAKGKGGSMHLIDVANGVMGASAVVGTTIPQAAGFAYAMKLRRSGNLVVSFFGDGAVEEGVFHETLNFASLKQLPMIFICENNSYAIMTHLRKRQPNADIIARVHAYGIPVERIESGDVFQIHERTRAAADALRAGKPGPFFIECLTYRWKEHVGPNDDYHLGYRNRDEVEPWIRADAIGQVGGMLDPIERKQIESEVDAEVREAFDFAENSPFPGLEELTTDVFK
jgi:TPP-dependent pyruvate/acetoin dehydrogenase alpha subunit